MKKKDFLFNISDCINDMNDYYHKFRHSDTNEMIITIRNEIYHLEKILKELEAYVNSTETVL